MAKRGKPKSVSEDQVRITIRALATLLADLAKHPPSGVLNPVLANLMNPTGDETIDMTIRMTAGVSGDHIDLFVSHTQHDLANYRADYRIEKNGALRRIPSR